MKSKTSKIVRSIYTKLAPAQLPENIAVYFHEVRGSWLPHFEEMLQFFKSENYQFVGTQEFLKNDENKKILLTFDDCYQNWLNAGELMMRHNATGVFYLTSGVFRDEASEAELKMFYSRVNRSSRENTLDTREMSSLIDMGHTLGVHGHRHLNLAAVEQSEGIEDIVLGKNRVDEICGFSVEDYAFPYGMPRYFPAYAREKCCELGLKRVAYGCGGRLWETTGPGEIHRTLWKLWMPLSYNLESLRIDGGLYAKFFGRDSTSDGAGMPKIS